MLGARWRRDDGDDGAAACTATRLARSGAGLARATRGAGRATHCGRYALGPLAGDVPGKADDEGANQGTEQHLSQ